MNDTKNVVITYNDNSEKTFEGVTFKIVGTFVFISGESLGDTELYISSFSFKEFLVK